jgi:hypothetical protein
MESLMALECSLTGWREGGGAPGRFLGLVHPSTMDARGGRERVLEVSDDTWGPPIGERGSGTHL